MTIRWIPAIGSFPSRDGSWVYFRQILGTGLSMFFRIVLLSVCFACATVGNAAERLWPGAPPDCWREERNIHGGDSDAVWQANTVIRKLNNTLLKPGIFSPNKGYFFVTEGGRPSGAVTIYAEKTYLIRIEFAELFGLSEVKWVNERLLFMRPWWGRIAATDLIYDVEAEKIPYAESATDAYLAFQQFRESCPVQSCECIKKKTE
jgi:hypothetical protein